MYEDNGLWLVDSRESSHMTGLSSMFHSISETGLDFHVSCGASTTHAVKGVGCVKFQLESGGFLEVTWMLFVSGLMVHFLSVSTLEDDGYRVLFRDGQVLLCLDGATLDAAIVLGTRQE